MDADPVATQLRFPDLSEGNPSRVLRFGSGRDGDRLFMTFVEHPVPAHSLVVDDYTSVRISPETNEVVGIEMEYDGY